MNTNGALSRAARDVSIRRKTSHRSRRRRTSAPHRPAPPGTSPHRPASPRTVHTPRTTHMSRATRHCAHDVMTSPRRRSKLHATLRSRRRAPLALPGTSTESKHSHCIVRVFNRFVAQELFCPLVLWCKIIVLN